MLNTQRVRLAGDLLVLLSALAFLTSCGGDDVSEKPRRVIKPEWQVDDDDSEIDPEKEFYERLNYDQGNLTVSIYKVLVEMPERDHPRETKADSYIESEGRTIYGELLRVDGSHKVSCWSAGNYGVWVETYPKSEETDAKKALYLYRHKDQKLILLIEIESDGFFDMTPDEDFLAVVRKNQPEIDISEAENLAARTKSE